MWCADCMLDYQWFWIFSWPVSYALSFYSLSKWWDLYLIITASEFSPGFLLERAVALNSSACFVYFAFPMISWGFFFSWTITFCLLYTFIGCCYRYLSMCGILSFKLRAIFRLVFAVPAATIHIKWTIDLARTIEYFRLGVIHHR